MKKRLIFVLIVLILSFRLGTSALQELCYFTQTTKSVNAGESFTITVNISREEIFNAVEFEIIYDPDYLTFENTNENANNVIPGKIKFVKSLNGTFLQETFIFKAVRGGQSTINVQNVYCSDGLDEYPLTGASCTVDITADLRGDADANGVVDIIDLALLKKHLAGISENLQNKPDLNSDGVTDIVDLALLKKHLAGNN